MAETETNIPGVEEQPKPHLSFSRLDVLGTCSLKHHLQYNLRIRDEKSPNLFFGTAVHDGLEELHKNIRRGKGKKIILPDVDYVLEYFSESWANQVLTNDIDFESQKTKTSADELEHLGIVMLSNYLKKGPTHDELGPLFVPPIATELRFEVPLINMFTGEEISSKYVFTGKIDLIILTEPYGLLVLDHKTSASVYADYKIKLGMQLTSYAYSTRYLINEGIIDVPKSQEDEVGFNVFLKYKTKPTTKLYRTPRIDEDMWRFYKFIEHAIRRVEQTDTFFPEEGLQCSYCPYQQACQVYGTEWFERWVLANKPGDKGTITLIDSDVN